MLSNPSDREVIERVLEGDTEAFGLLVDRYQDSLAAYAKYMTGNLDEAEDIVQESFVRAFKALRKCKDRDRFSGWLFRIVSNQCKTHLARRKRRKEEPLASAAQQADLGRAEQQAEAEELRRKVHEALQRIPADQREALVLRYVHGMSLAEMTELLATTVPALKMRLLRGRQNLRSILAEMGIHDTGT
ncbi:MAG: ECF RNA polymerase sigma-E factor [Gemmatimonadales bacterium]|nr:MAG: ECF RNA polymerase sigma-E factor [Gemmatimonadales bacterium]